jgi:hypothetical protein
MRRKSDLTTKAQKHGESRFSAICALLVLVLLRVSLRP